MKRIFRFLFSRFTIGAILIISQVFALIYAINYAYTIYSWVQFLVVFLEVILVVDLTNRDMPADLKLPWLAVALFIPIAGIIIYFIFSRNYARKRDQKFYNEILESSQKSISEFEMSSESLGRDYQGQSNYIKNTCHCGVFANTRTKYYNSGESFFQDYLEDIKNAKKFIFMEYYIVDHGVMFDTILEVLKDKVKEGVEVRFIYDDIGSIGTLSYNFDKILKNEGINCIKFHPFLPIVSAIHNNRDHRKITVIDGKISYVGGINLADEYINVKEKYGYWKDSTIRLEGDATRQMTVMFLQSFDVQTRKKDDYEKYTKVEFDTVGGSGFVQPVCDGPSPIFYELICENVYLNMINQAKKSIFISTPYLVIDTQIKNALVSAAKRNVRVKIVTPHIPDKKTVFMLTRSNYFDLMKNGIEIYEYQPGFIHAKNFLVDDEIAVVGTINLDYRSLVHHYECGVWMYKTETIKEIKEDFETILKDSIYIDPKNFKMKFGEKVFVALFKIFSPLM